MIRRRGVAIVETTKGILLVADKSKVFMFPGGGAKRYESRKRAAIRELYEETGLKTKKIEYLFKYHGSKWHFPNGKPVINHTKVFLVQAEGIPKPSNEIKFIEYWNPKSKLPLSSGTRAGLKKYFREFKYN